MISMSILSLVRVWYYRWQCCNFSAKISTHLAEYKPGFFFPIERLHVQVENLCSMDPNVWKTFSDSGHYVTHALCLGSINVALFPSSKLILIVQNCLSLTPNKCFMNETHAMCMRGACTYQRHAFNVCACASLHLACWMRQGRHTLSKLIGWSLKQPMVELSASISGIFHECRFDYCCCFCIA